MSERVNRDLITYLRILVYEKQNSWVSKVDYIRETINTTYHSTIEMTT